MNEYDEFSDPGSLQRQSIISGIWYPVKCLNTTKIVCMSAQDGSWIPVDLLPTRLRHFWSSPCTCDRLTVVISTSHVWNLLRTEGVHLHTPALQTGTHFRLTLETIVFLFHLLGATSKPFSSLSTRLANAARLGVLFTKTRYINSLLLRYRIIYRFVF